MTRARLPQSFLWAFGLVKHPENEQLWWVPEGIEQRSKEAASESQENQDTLAAEPVTADDFAGAQANERREPPGRFWAPAHILARQDLMEQFNSKRQEYSGGQFRFAGMPSVGSKAARAVWRMDMQDVLREHMRRGVVDQLVHASQVLGEGEGWRTLVKLDQVEDSLKYQNRVCFLLTSGSYTPFGYLEVLGTPGTARAAYHLPELLGPEHMSRLETEAPKFCDGPLWLLKGKGNMKINKSLWSLQGFVADYQKLK